MSILESQQVLRTAPEGLAGWFRTRVLAATPFVFGVLRLHKPIMRIGSFYLITRYDDVIEIFRKDESFDTPYKANIEVLTGGEPFFLGMRDTETYRADLAAIRKVVQIEDLTMMGDRAEALALDIVEASGGQLDVVDELVRKVTFALYSEYLGIPEPSVGRLDVWSTRLFEFQFTGSAKDVELRAEVDEIAPAFRDHIDQEIVRRHQDGDPRDDVLGRCLTLQSEGDAQFTDLFIRTNMLCMIVGGPPQLPMVIPQALEQLLQRPRSLELAVDAARSDSDVELWKIVREAMRFDPLGPGLPRITTNDVTIARGTRRETTIPKGATVLTAFSSAMMDNRRLPNPQSFDANRLSYEYVHFGHGLHECFGRFLNEATLHRILKPLFLRKNLARAKGKDGHLKKNGIFSERLVVTYE